MTRLNVKGSVSIFTLLSSTLACIATILCSAPAVGAAPRLLPSDGPDKAAVQELLDQLDDIDIMRSLSPLKLTGEQIDKLISVINEAKTQYDKKIGDLSATTVGKMADEIHKRHKEAVAGGEASKAFDDKVKSLVTTFNAEREKINADNLVAMTAACGKIITADQQLIAAQMEKDTLFKMGKKPSATDKNSQYFNLYVVDIFIGYRRIVPLLKEMKSAGG